MQKCNLLLDKSNDFDITFKNKEQLINKVLTAVRHTAFNKKKNIKKSIIYLDKRFYHCQFYT